MRESCVLLQSRYIEAREALSERLPREAREALSEAREALIERGVEAREALRERSFESLEALRERGVEARELLRERSFESLEALRERGFEAREAFRERGFESLEALRERGCEAREALSERLPKGFLNCNQDSSASKDDKSKKGDSASKDDKSNRDQDVRAKRFIATPILVGIMYMLSNSQSSTTGLQGPTGRKESMDPLGPMGSLSSMGADFFSDRFGDSHALEWPARVRASVFFALVAISYAIHLSLAVPQPCSTKTWKDVWVQLLLFLGDMILLPYYALFPDVKCDIAYDSSSERNRRVIAAAPTLQRYRITFWLRNSWLNMMLPGFKEGLRWKFDRERYLSIVRREIVPLSQGGQVALDWYTAGDALPATAPVLFLGSTLMGDGRSEPTADIAKRFSAKGWRCVCFVKRGCGYFDMLPLTQDDWMPTCPSSFHEVKTGLEMVRKMYPQSFLALAGLSAGASWIRQYCAWSGAKNVADAAFSLDGGFKWLETVKHVDANTSFVGKVLGTAQARPLLLKAEAQPPPPWLDIQRLAAAQQISWSEVLDTVNKPSVGARSVEDWFANNADFCNDLPQRSAIPLLIVCSYADGCCPDFYWTEFDPVKELPSKCPNTFVCINACGAHCFRASGLLGNGNWGADVALEFFDAVRDESSHDADQTR